MQRTMEHYLASTPCHFLGNKHRISKLLPTHTQLQQLHTLLSLFTCQTALSIIQILIRKHQAILINNKQMKILVAQLKATNKITLLKTAKEIQVQKMMMYQNIVLMVKKSQMKMIPKLCHSIIIQKKKLSICNNRLKSFTNYTKKKLIQRKILL